MIILKLMPFVPVSQMVQITMTLEDAQALRNELGYARSDFHYPFQQVYALHRALAKVTEPTT